MPEWTAEQIAQAAFDRDLIDERQFRELWSELGSGQLDADGLQQLLVRRELVTNYQVKKLLRGERHGYFYGPYKVLYKIGSGTFARVYRAVHRETGQIRAVKVLRTEPAHGRSLNSEEPDPEQFMREGEMGRALKHPNIVPIYEVNSDGRFNWIVMEFIEGRNLREFMKARRLEPAEAIRLAIDICRGLDYAFQRGISHRDLKASNVIISSLAQAKLLDFGLAGTDPAASDDDLEKIENPRTVDYTALERATGVRKDDSRSDIFFLGAMLYQMLSGQPALEETRDRRSRMSKRRFDDIKPIGEVMPELYKDIAAVVTKAMKLDPNARYQTPAEMLSDLVVLSDRLAGGGNSKIVGVGRPALRQRSVMIVEPNAQVQEALRNQFKAEGFRVLLTTDPERPASMFTDANQKPDCVIFSTLSLGEEALRAFNEFGDMPSTNSVPAILLLGKGHHDWVGRAKTTDWRTAVPTPIKMKRLLALLDTLSPAAVAKD
jgi:eukaryotic-like serine/threonine-protein kinase